MERRAGLPLPFDGGGEPGRQVIGVREGTPDLRRLVPESPPVPDDDAATAVLQLAVVPVVACPAVRVGSQGPSSALPVVHGFQVLSKGVEM